jgi:ribosomal-protein-alanine N-acetyltransferase
MNCKEILTPDGERDTVELMLAPLARLNELLQLDSLCFGPLAWRAQAWEEVLANPAWTTVVWCPDGPVRGAMVVLLSRPESSLASLAVHPAYRRRGVGRSFVKDAVRRARDVGAKWMSLEVDRNNRAAVVLYFRAGFRVCRRFDEDGRPRLEMCRRLARAQRRGALSLRGAARFSLL